MLEYEPIDLSSLCNAGPEIVGKERPPHVGDQTFHGLPFQIGPAGPPCFIAFGPGLTSNSVLIPIGKSAQWVIFAHRILNSRLHKGDPPGRVFARYTFVYDDGERVTAPIRERFETGDIPPGWGELPFAAVPDQMDRIVNDRYQGHWGAAGYRQTEVSQASPRDYYLWAWQNPHPDRRLARIEILPGDAIAGNSPEFLIAAVTLSHLEEAPFCRAAGVPVKLTLPRSEDAGPPFALEVEVDRGSATFPFPLPEQPDEAFLNDPLRGWGESYNESNSPAYVEIAANPSATVSVRRDGEELGQARWSELESGPVERDRVRLEIVDTGRNWVHTTVLDEDTGKPIPCRIHFRSPGGIPYAPHGHHAHVNSNLGTWHIDVGGDLRLGQISYAYIDGRCQGWLPRGEVIVDAARGFEYEPLRTRVTIEPGQRELTLRLKRTQNLNRDRRYFSGDTHVHFLSTQGALTEAAAEDLDVVNLLLSQWGHLFTNTEEFTGQPALAGDRETIVYASQENRQHLLGHLTLLGLKSPVSPWCSDGPSEAELGGNLETTLSYWADACHAQGGTVVIPHLPNPNGEPAALIATGRADAVEMLVHNPFFHLEYYRYLNGGYRLPLAGGTDKMDSGVPVGLYRTYAYIPPDEPFTYENWCKALRSGNTFLSGGPLLSFTANGEPIGATLQLGRDGGTIEVEATATSIFPIHTLQIVQGGEVVAAADSTGGQHTLNLKVPLKIERSGWICARCAGPHYTSVSHHDSWGRGIMAHTSPIYLSCGGYDVCSPETLQYMLTLVDGSLQHIRGRAPQWKPGTVTHHHGEEDHRAFLERPFQEAIARIHQKMHEHGIPH